MSDLRVQKRLAADVLGCGKHRVWLDNTEIARIKMANSREAIKKLKNDNIIAKRPVHMHSTERHYKRTLAKRKGRHRGLGSRKGTANARTNSKWLWIRRIRVLRRTLADLRKNKEIDCHLYRKLYLQAKGGQFRNKRVIIEHVHTLKAEHEREKTLQAQVDARRERSRRIREKKKAAVK